MDERPGRPRGSRSARGGGEAVLLFDRSGDLLFASPELARLVGQSIERETDLETALSLEHGSALQAAELLGGAPSEQPLDRDVGDPNGHLRLTVHAIELSAGNGEPVRLVVARDVTRSRESRAMRDAFARILAHELRTPITTIYGGAQLMADASISEETRREAATTVAHEAERLYRTVEDLLVFASLDDALELGDAPVLLQRFVPQLVHAEAERLQGVRLAVRLPDDLPPVRGRQGSIEQVLRHLIASAARFAPRGSTVRVTGSDKVGFVELRIVDHGPPITPLEAETMFDLFTRTPRASSDASGANLGLYVARRLVEAMGGSIRALASRRPTLVVSLSVFPPED
jgi:signal transduction histidine kinase